MYIHDRVTYNKHGYNDKDTRHACCAPNYKKMEAINEIVIVMTHKQSAESVMLTSDTKLSGRNILV